LSGWPFVGNARSEFTPVPCRTVSPESGSTLAPLSSGVIFDLTSSAQIRPASPVVKNNQIINIFVPIMV